MIVSKTVGVEGRLRNTLSSIYGIRLAFIYDSYAGRKEKGSSDIDLMIIGNPDTSLLNEKIAELEKKDSKER
jgi:predicted nucleotidyltransferase